MVNYGSNPVPVVIPSVGIDRGRFVIEYEQACC